jgi:hypothetical protein
MSNKPDEKHSEAMRKLLQLHTEQLGEYFDNVQVFVSRVTDGGDYTESFTWGAGNWHARLGQIRQFVLNSDEHERIIQGRIADDEYDAQDEDSDN